MIEFLRRHQVVFASAIFLSLSLFLLTANRGGVRRFDPLGAIFLEVLRPLQGGLATAIAHGRGLWLGYVELTRVAEENERLKIELRALEGEHRRTTEIELANRRLERLLEVRAEIPAKALAVRVVGKDASGWFATFTVDRGERDGVAVGMAVVAPEGVVGRIAQTSPHAARVLLVSDHNSGVDALVQRTRARGIVEGTLSGKSNLKYVKPTEDLVPGDLVVTSGLDGIFPKGLLLGRVTAVTRKDASLFQGAEVEPAVDFPRLEEALVLTTPPAQVNAALEAAEAVRVAAAAALAETARVAAEAARMATAVAAGTPLPITPTPTSGARATAKTRTPAPGAPRMR